MWKYVSTSDELQVWYAHRQVDIMCLRLTRLEKALRFGHRGIIDWLIRKPGAFENYRYREELFPTTSASIWCTTNCVNTVRRRVLARTISRFGRMRRA